MDDYMIKSALKKRNIYILQRGSIIPGIYISIYPYRSRVTRYECERKGDRLRLHKDRSNKAQLTQTDPQTIGGPHIT